LSTATGEPLEHAIVKSLKLQWNQGIGEARLQLKPEYLGELSVTLRVQGSTVTAVLQSDSPAVRAWVENHQGELRRALEEAGLSLDSLVIDADGHPRDQQDQAPPDDRRQQPGRRPVPPGRFEALL
jgi:flagellar hook-length control protein FliK